MSATHKLYQGQAANTATAIFTAAQPTTIVHLRAVNLDTSARTLKLWQGASAVDATCILPALSIAAGGWLEGGGLFLEKGEKLYAQGSVGAKITLTVYGGVDFEADDEPLAAFGFKVFSAAGFPGIESSVATLDSVGDVTITDAADGQVLTHDGTGWVNEAIPAVALDALSDVTVDTPADNELVVYVTDHWENQTIVEANLLTFLGIQAGPTADPPTSANLGAAFAETASVPGIGVVLGSTGIYLAVWNGTVWYYVALTAAA